MAQRRRTKSLRRQLWLFRILDMICLLAPVLIYIGIALSSDGIQTVQKVAVVSTTLIAIILTVFNVIAQKRLRCPIWIILIGLFVAIKEMLLPLIIILAITSVLDDLVFTPLIGHYKTALIASKEVDVCLKEYSLPLKQ